MAGRPIFPYFEDARPTFGLMDVKKNGRMTGPVLSEGPYWKELRRFLIRNLKDCGFGKSAMEDAIQEEAEKLCNHLTKKTGIYRQSHTFLSITKTLILVTSMQIWTLLISPAKHPVSNSLFPF